MKSSSEKLYALLDTANDNQKKLDRLQTAELHLLQSDTLPGLFNYLFNEYRELFQLYSVDLLLIDTRYGIQRLLEDSGESAKNLHSLQLTTDEACIKKIEALGHEPILCTYAESDHRWLLTERVPEPASIAILPLVRHHHAIGVVTCASTDANRFSPSYATDLLQRLAGILAISIENAVNYHRLQYLGLTDALTGARNRRFLDQRLVEEVASASTSNKPLCFLFIDIDHFKQVNDNYGHPAGDQVLYEIARRTNIQLRANDVLVRYGGEEFAVLLTNTDINEAERVAERIRMAIEQDVIVCDGHSLAITTSIGVAKLSGTSPAAGSHEELAAQLTRAADEALYEAKESGRNRVVVSGK